MVRVRALRHGPPPFGTPVLKPHLFVLEDN